MAAKGEPATGSLYLVRSAEPLTGPRTGLEPASVGELRALSEETPEHGWQVRPANVPCLLLDYGTRACPRHSPMPHVLEPKELPAFEELTLALYLAQALALALALTPKMTLFVRIGDVSLQWQLVEKDTVVPSPVEPAEVDASEGVAPGYGSGYASGPVIASGGRGRSQPGRRPKPKPRPPWQVSAGPLLSREASATLGRHRDRGHANRVDVHVSGRRTLRNPC